VAAAVTEITARTGTTEVVAAVEAAGVAPEEEVAGDGVVPMDRAMTDKIARNTKATITAKRCRWSLVQVSWKCTRTATASSAIRGTISRASGPTRLCRAR
jgi:hypothetical protein